MFRNRHTRPAVGCAGGRRSWPVRRDTTSARNAIVVGSLEVRPNLHITQHRKLSATDLPRRSNAPAPL